MTDLGNTDSLTTAAMIYITTTLAITWISMALWTLRDIRSRSRDTLVQLLATLIVSLIPIPGLLIYLFLRPRETLSEAYERSLEEEALLQEIERKNHCPGCGQNVQDKWQICAYCHTQLKRHCISCKQLLELPWEICPYCATPQRQFSPEPVQTTYTDPAYEPRIRVSRQSSTSNQSRNRIEGLEFIEEDDF